MEICELKREYDCLRGVLATGFSIETAHQLHDIEEQLSLAHAGDTSEAVTQLFVLVDLLRDHFGEDTTFEQLVQSALDVLAPEQS